MALLYSLSSSNTKMLSGVFFLLRVFFQGWGRGSAVKVLTTLPDDPSRFPAPTRRIPSTHKQLLVTQILGIWHPLMVSWIPRMWTMHRHTCGHISPPPPHSKNKYISRQKFQNYLLWLSMFFDVNFRISFFFLILWRISLKIWGDNNTFVGRIANFKILILFFQFRSMEGLSFIKVSYGMLYLIYSDYLQVLSLRLLWMGHTFFSDFFPSKFVGVGIH